MLLMQSDDFVLYWEGDCDDRWTNYIGDALAIGTVHTKARPFSSDSHHLLVQYVLYRTRNVSFGGRTDEPRLGVQFSECRLMVEQRTRQLQNYCTRHGRDTRRTAFHSKNCQTSTGKDLLPETPMRWLTIC